MVRKVFTEVLMATLKSKGVTFWKAVRRGLGLYKYDEYPHGEDRHTSRYVSTMTRGHFEFEAAPIGLARLNLLGDIESANPALCALLGVDADQLVGRALHEFIYSVDSQRLRDGLQRLQLGTGNQIRDELRVLHAAGHHLWASLHVRMQRDPLPSSSALILALEDITHQYRERELAAASHWRFRSLVEHNPTVVAIFSADFSQILYLNEAFETVWGESRDKVYASPANLLELIHPEDRECVLHAFSGAERDWQISYRILRKDGEIRHVRDSGHAVFDESRRLQFFANSSVDVTNEMQIREDFRDLNIRLQEANLRLTESARLDGLTRCLNRAAFFDEAAKAMQIDTRYGRSSTLIFFDLNNFKQVNDTFGHHVGDRALVAFADQIRSRLRNTDELGRYGGDEFIALLRETDTTQAQALLATLQPVVVEADGGRSLILRYSAGLAVISDPSIQTVDDWIRLADNHMYRQKAQGGSR